MPDRNAFIAGVHFFGAMVATMAGRKFETDHELHVECRDGKPLALHLASQVRALLKHPEMADGFAAALGDYLATVEAGDSLPSNYYLTISSAAVTGQEVAHG